MTTKTVTPRSPTLDRVFPSSAPSGADSSSLDSEETSGIPFPPTDYRTWIARDADASELNATHEAFEAVFPLTSQRLQRLRNCRRHARFYVSIETGEVKVVSSLCHDRWCPTCAHAKGTRIAGRVSAWALSTPSPKLLTLTLRSSDAPLSHQFKSIIAAFKALRQDPLWKETVSGGIWFFQVTWNADRNQWHPHIHCVIDASFFDQKTLSRLWSKYSHGSKIVDIRKVANEAHVATYVSRYVARPLELKSLPIDRRAEIITETKGVRFVNTFGNAHNAGLLRKETMDFAEWKCIASWFGVASWFAVDRRSQAIWMAWLTDTPFDFQKFPEAEFPQGTPKNTPRSPPEEVQLDLPLEGERAELWTCKTYIRN